MKAFRTLTLAAALTAVSLTQAQPNSSPQSNSAVQSSWSIDKRQGNFNLNDGLGLYGYDPISYFAGKPAKGEKSITSQYQGVTYRFANAANKQQFDAAPAKYEPAYGGWCAWAMAQDGDKVEIDPESYKIVEGRLFLFYDGFWGDTLKEWNKSGQQAQLTQQADQHWAKAAE